MLCDDETVFLDAENPRDFIDYLILENRRNEDIGYSAISGSILHLGCPGMFFHNKYQSNTLVQLFLGAGDTLTNTMRWLCLILSLHPEVQKKCHTELEKCFDEYQVYLVLKSVCPYVCATLEEVFRFRPVGDSLAHYTSEEISVKGVTIPKKTGKIRQFQLSLLQWVLQISLSD